METWTLASSVVVIKKQASGLFKKSVRHCVRFMVKGGSFVGAPQPPK